METPGPHFSW